MPDDADVAVLLESMGLRLLERLDELVEIANARISSELPSYRQLVPPDDLQASGKNIVGMVLRRLSGTSTSEMEESVKSAFERGRQRQRQGVALEDVLRAVRLDFAVLWEPVTRISKTDLLPAEVGSLAMLRVWESLDGVMVAVAEGYRYQEALADREAMARKSRALTNLVYEPLNDPAEVARTAEVLGLDQDMDLLVVAARLGERQESHLEMRWRSNGSSAHVVSVGDHVVGVTGWDRRNHDVLSGMVAGFEDRLAVVAPTVHGLADVHAALTLARSVLAGAPPGRVTQARDLLIESLVVSQSAIATPLAEVLLHGITQLPAGERERLLETLEAWMEVDGTTADVAHRLFRHRNTVNSHLRRVHELTGLSPSRPADVATLVAALKSARSWMVRP